MTVALSRGPIPVFVQQHAGGCAMLRHVRSVLVRAPHVRLHQLRRLDKRIDAHLDGLVVAGDYRASLCMAALERSGAGETLACAALALQRRDHATLDWLLSLAAVLADAKHGLLSALGWVSADLLKGELASWLASGDPPRRELGLGTCRLHGVDPGSPLIASLDDENTGVRVETPRSAAALGREDLIDMARDAHRDHEPRVRRHAPIAATILGDRGAMLGLVIDSALPDRADCDDELALALQASQFEAARKLLPTLAPGDATVPSPRLVRASGLLADAQLVPRPDQGRVQRWWRYVADKVPVGRCLFLGEAPRIERAWRALRDGFQRQRANAARWCSLQSPGTKLLATVAPAWLQQRRFAATT